MVPIYWPDLTFPPINLWTVWPLKPSKGENLMAPQPLRKQYTQVCVWPGINLGDVEDPEIFEDEVGAILGARIQYLETIITKPDMASGKPVEGTGGRTDLFFAVHEADIKRFSLARLPYGIHWIEDMISEANGGNTMYPDYVEHYISWDANGASDGQSDT